MEPQLRFEPELSWSAIVAGAVTAVAISLLLTLLAAGFGDSLSSSIMTGHAALASFTPTLGALAVAVQVISAGLGGYLAGRLRHQWPSAHLDEAHFRDTAQGLIAWALATLIGLGFAAVAMPLTMQAAMVAAATPAAPLDPVREANLMAQSAFFTAVGMLLAAFTAAVAARVGGMRAEEMHEKRPVVAAPSRAA